MELRFVRELSPPRFAELGKPAGGWRRADGRFAALASDLDSFYWRGRAIHGGHRLRHRLSVYDADLQERIAVFDGARFPINDVAFHPSAPLVAIGTGSYDGGWFFEGDLWLWNWERDEVTSLLPESRDVAQCRWLDGERLAVLLRPRDEEEFPGSDDSAFVTYVGLVLDGVRDVDAQPASPGQLAGLLPIDPATLGFDSPPMRHPDRRRYFDSVMGATPHEERTRVWDVLWLAPDRLAVAHDQCHVEVWDTETGAKIRDHRGEGHGVQLLHALGAPLVHVHRRADFRSKVDDRSSLHRITADGLEHVRTFDHAVVLSTDGAGNLLCRDAGDLTNTRSRADIVLSASNEVCSSSDLGRYDCFNHYLRLDGGDGLYFLRGTPPSSHEDKRLCRVHLDGSIDEVLRWDGPSHHMASTACWVHSTSLIRAFATHHPKPGAGSKCIERCDLATGTSRWQTAIDAPATALVVVGDAVVYGLTNGTFGVLDAGTGAKAHERALQIDGVASIVTALSARGETVAVGTIDGRVLLFELG